MRVATERGETPLSYSPSMAMKVGVLRRQQPPRRGYLWLLRACPTRNKGGKKKWRFSNPSRPKKGHKTPERSKKRLGENH